MVWLIIGSVFILILILIMISKVYVSLCYTYRQHTHDIMLTVKLNRFKIYNKKWQLTKQDHVDIFDMVEDMDISSSIDGFKKSFRNGWQKVKRGWILLKGLLTKTYFHQINWQTTVGTGDASSTGILTGGIWTLKGSMIAMLEEMAHVTDKPTISITPNFQMKQLESKFDCMVSIRVGQAIYMVFKSLRKLPTKQEAYI